MYLKYTTAFALAAIFITIIVIIHILLMYLSIFMRAADTRIIFHLQLGLKLNQAINVHFKR